MSVYDHSQEMAKPSETMWHDWQPINWGNDLEGRKCLLCGEIQLYLGSGNWGHYVKVEICPREGDLCSNKLFPPCPFCGVHHRKRFGPPLR